MEVVKVKIPNSTERSFLIKEQNAIGKDIIDGRTTTTYGQI